jgi:hypothetical protein
VSIIYIYFYIYFIFIYSTQYNGLILKQ